MNNVERIVSIKSCRTFRSGLTVEDLDIVVDPDCGDKIFEHGIFYIPKALTKKEISTINSLLKGTHKITRYLNKIVKTYGSVNYLDIIGFDELKQLITFKYSSLPNLLNAMAYMYIDNSSFTPFVPAGTVIGVNPDNPEKCVVYTQDKFFVVDKTILSENLSKDNFAALMPYMQEVKLC